MSLTDYAENAFLNHVMGNTAYSTGALTIALSTTSISEDGSGITRPIYAAYADQSIIFGAPTSRALSNTSDISFPQKADGGTETITHWAIFQSSNMLAYGSLSASKEIVINNTPKIASSQVEVSVDAGSNTGMSDYLANAFLDFMFRAQPLAQPTIYVALTTATISDSDTGSTITEPSGNAYVRDAFSDWSTSSSSTLNNNTVIQFATPTGTWGTITSAAILDGSTGGNLLYYDNSNITDQLVGLDDDVQFNSNDFVLNAN